MCLGSILICSIVDLFIVVCVRARVCVCVWIILLSELYTYFYVITFFTINSINNACVKKNGSVLITKLCYSLKW